MSKILLTTIVITTVAIMAAACTGTPYLYNHWGKSIETAKKSQIANPQAGQQPIHTLEMDGKKAGHAVDSYHQSDKGSAPK